MISRLTALPVIRLPQQELGGIGKTDFKNIFIASELNDNEFAVVQTHEESHVWLYHNKRAALLLKEKGKYSHELWNVATDLEIARNIYTDKEVAVIKSPRSRLTGGIVSDSIENLPDNLLYAEEIYDWLLKNKPDNLDAQWNCTSEDDNDNNNTPLENIKEVIEVIKEFKKEQKEQKEKHKQRKQVQESLTKKLINLKFRKPSLVEEINSGLRVRNERIKSYARQGRRELEFDIFCKGRKNIAMPPLVEIFIDRSGSFCPKKTEEANEAVNKILNRYNASIRHDTFYFGNNELREKDNGFGGNTPYNLIFQHITKSKPKIAIVVTDDDVCEQPNFALPKQTKILCIPIGCKNTIFAAKSNGKDVFII